MFPRDAALFEPQARFFFVDELVASLIRVTGGGLEVWFAAGYLLTLALLFGSLAVLGRTVFASPLAVAALLAAGTLRHRITKTGVNTLEGYFHPRMLVFAVGVGAVVLYLRGRPWLAIALISAAGVIHPSTTFFFVLLLGPAVWVTEPHARRPLMAAAIAGALVAAVTTWLRGAGALAPMDAEWLALLETKDYLLPTRVWPLHAWLLNAATAALAIVGLSARVRSGAAHPRERGLLAGAIVLATLFVVTLPAVHAGVTFFVQLQVSRVFWLLELLALIPVIWWVVDRPARQPGTRRLALAVCIGLFMLSAARGVWIAFVERHGDIVAVSMRAAEWTRTLSRLTSITAQDSHVLVDPGHAWRYGYPVRAFGRDVFLEDQKDTAMALYSRAAAARVIERSRALGDFPALSAERARDLAAQYDLDYLVTPAELELPLVFREGQFSVYRLR